MLSCKIGVHRWTRREKQWLGLNGAVISKRCRYCGRLSAERNNIIDLIKIGVKKLGGMEWHIKVVRKLIKPHEDIQKEVRNE